ncbi:hypothetical protein Tco_0186214 [Tanacetum coccineum]
MPKYTFKSTDKATLKEYDQKSALYQTMHENKSFNKNPANHALYHSLMEALIEDENTMDKGVADTVKNPKRQHDDDDDEDPSAGPNQGFKTGKSASAKESVEEPIDEVAMDDAVNTAGKDVVRDDNQLQDTSKPKTYKTPNQDSFKQPPRPPTPDPEWNKRRTGHLTIAVDYLFNNDLEYLKTSDLEKTYKTSITKTKAARYEIVGIEDMTTTIWSNIKHAYGKDAKKRIKHWGERQVVVKRADQQLYKFKKGDFVDLYLNDIEDMLLFAVQHKQFNLNNSDIVDCIVALRMFTRSLIIKRRVGDL